MKIQKNGRKRGIPGQGIGPHAQVSPMGHATRTKNKRDRINKSDRKAKQGGWQ